MNVAQEIRGIANRLGRSTATALHQIADQLVEEEAQTVERLAVAGQQAAEAQALADRLAADAAIAAQYKQLATDATRLASEAVAQLVRERQANQTAQRTIAYLLNALGQDDDVEVHVAATDDPDALDPKYLTDILCALAGIDPRPTPEPGHETETA